MYVFCPISEDAVWQLMCEVQCIPSTTLAELAGDQIQDKRMRFMHG